MLPPLLDPEELEELDELDEEEELELDELDDEEPPEGLLGDVVICPEVAEKQATTAGHDVRLELGVLLTHGILHLLGYDHADPDDERLMFGLQRRLLGEWQTEGSR